MPFTCKSTPHTFIGSSFSMTYRQLNTLILMLSLFITTPAFSANYQQGLDAYSKGDYVTALEHWRPLAEQGDVNAQYNLGLMYADGEGVPQDDKAAIKWYGLAAMEGSASALFSLGLMYADGLGVPQNYNAAVTLFWFAAGQGDVGAQFSLGLMYAYGQGVPQDHKAAVKWYTRAAEQGVAMAQYNLGVMYAYGNGVIQDYVRSHMWYNIAVSNGADSKNRDLVAEMMTPSQIEEAQNLAREWVVNHGG